MKIDRVEEENSQLWVEWERGELSWKTLGIGLRATWDPQ